MESKVLYGPLNGDLKLVSHISEKQSIDNLLVFLDKLDQARLDRTKPLCLILDNASGHHSVKFYRECIKRGIWLEFTGVASCEFNAVESAFSVLKRRVRERVLAKDLVSMSRITGEVYKKPVQEVVDELDADMAMRLLRASYPSLARS